MLAAHRSSSRVLLLLTVLIVVAYGGSLRNEFVFDDAIFTRHDPRLRSLDEGLRLFVEPLWGFGDQEGRSRVHQYYRPLQTFPLAVSYAAFGESAWPSHGLNLLLHLLNSLMAFLVFRRFLSCDRAPSATSGASPFGKGGPRGIPFAYVKSPLTPLWQRGENECFFWSAALAAALFAIHPGYSEAVLWVSNIAGLGATACTLAVVLLHCSTPARRWYGQLGIAVLFLLGLWFKESGILAPALIGLYDLTLAPDRGWALLWRHRRRYAVFIPPFAVYYALRVHALGGTLPGFETVPLSGWELTINAAALLPQYVATFLWPFNLNMYHDFNAIHDAWNWPFVVGGVILAAAACLFAATLRSHPPIAFGVAWACVAAAPHLLIRWPQLNVYAERYLYLPSVGVFLALAYVGGRLAAAASRNGRRFAVAVIAALVLVFLVTNGRRTRDWHDELTLYGKTLTQSPRAELIRTNLAVRFLELGRYDEGIALLKELLVIDPDWRDTWHNLGLLYLAKGESDDALAAFERARERDPFRASTWLNLGYLYDRAGRREEAVAAYFRTVRLQPGNAEGWYNLALIAFDLGQYGNARAAAERVLSVAPEDREARMLMERLTALPLQPGRPPVTALPETARRCDAARRMADEGRHADAVIALQAAAWIDEASPLPHHFLANVYYLTGGVAEAAREQREALARAPDNELYRRNLAALEQALGTAAPR